MQQTLHFICPWPLSGCTSCRHLESMYTGYGAAIGVMVVEEPSQQKPGDELPSLMLEGRQGRDSCIYSQWELSGGRSSKREICPEPKGNIARAQRSDDWFRTTYLTREAGPAADSSPEHVLPACFWKPAQGQESPFPQVRETCSHLPTYPIPS